MPFKADPIQGNDTDSVEEDPLEDHNLLPYKAKHMKLPPEKLDAIVELSEKWKATYDGQERSSESFADWKEDGPPPARPEKLALYDAIDSLSDDEKYDLSAIAWIGRGDAVEFADAREYAKTFPTETTATYWASKLPLASYLKLGISLVRNQKT